MTSNHQRVDKTALSHRGWQLKYIVIIDTLETYFHKMPLDVYIQKEPQHAKCEYRYDLYQSRSKVLTRAKLEPNF